MGDRKEDYTPPPEEEKRRYEADPWNYWGNPNSPWAREEARRVRREKRRREQEECRQATRAQGTRPAGRHRRGFFARALAEARAVRASAEGQDEDSVPEDEMEALKLRLRAALRRQPGDTRGLMRAAEALWKLEVAARRMSPDKDKEHEQGRAMLRVLNSLNDPRILPPQ